MENDSLNFMSARPVKRSNFQDFLDEISIKPSSATPIYQTQRPRINLEHHATYGEPMFLNRVVAADAIDDFARTGYIQGTKFYGNDAYFVRGGLWHHGGPHTPYTITVDDALFRSHNNPLYRRGFGNPSWWENVPEMNKRNPMAVGAINTLEPRAQRAFSGAYDEVTGEIVGRTKGVGPSFIDTANPANRAGVRITGPNNSIVYDRITPVMKRPLSTHAANLKTEARIIGNAIRSNPVGATGTALGIAGSGLSVLDMYNRAEDSSAKYRSSREAELGKGDGEPFSYTQEFLNEVGARMPGYLRGLTSAATFGTYDALEPIIMQTGENGVSIDPNDMPSAAFYGP